MSDDAFDDVFGQRPERQSFQERVIRGEAFGGRSAPLPGMAAELADAPPVPGVYKAFGHVPVGNLNPSCEVRRWLDGTEIPEGTVFFYRLLMQIAFSGVDELRLVFPDMVVVLTGSRLDLLKHAVMRGQATFIQQWSGRVWNQPPAAGEAIVRAIEFVRAKSG